MGTDRKKRRAGKGARALRAPSLQEHPRLDPASARKSGVTPLPRGVGGDVVLFGGSFDPVHLWHTSVVVAARRRAGRFAWVLFVPAARSPHKLAEDGPRASDEDRVEMLRRATARMTRAAVWTDELDRARREPGTPSYTIETLRRLRGLCGSAERVRLLIGADQAAKFHLWREYQEVMRLAEVLVVLRPPLRSTSALARALRASGAWSEAEVAEWAQRVVKCDVRAVSSTGVRAAAARGDSKRLRTMVAPAVARWIEARGLYQAAASE